MFNFLFGWLFRRRKTTKPPTTPVPPPPPIDVVPPGTNDPIIVTDPNGEIELGHLDPVVPALKLTPKMAAVLHNPDNALRVDTLNDASAPRELTADDVGGVSNVLGEHPKDARGEPVCGPYTRGSDAFVGKGVVPVKMIFQGVVQEKVHAGDQVAAKVLAPLIDALSDAAWVRRPSMQFNINGEPGNRILFFDTTDAGNADADTLVREAGAQNLRLINQLVHFSADDDYSHNFDVAAVNVGSAAVEEELERRNYGWVNAQGFRLEDLLKCSVGPAGGSHVRAWSSGLINGNPVSVVSDWGYPPDVTCNFSSHIFAIDYQAGCRDMIPEATLRAYTHNADMWDAIATMQVPFSGEDTDEERFHDYMHNPLEVHDQASTVAVARKLAELNFPSFNKVYGGFYCSEAQYSVSNFGPQADTLIKESNFGPGTALHKLITEYQNAYIKPEYAQWSEEKKSQNPQVGWKHLFELGNADGNAGISVAQYESLAAPGMAGGLPRKFGVYLNFIGEETKGWQAYRPKNPEGMIASPMSMSTIVWAMVRMYLPREGVAKAIAQEIGRAYMHAVQTDNVDVQSAVLALTHGADPATPPGQKALAMIGAQTGSTWLIKMLGSDAIKNEILEKAGAKYIEPGNTADQDALSNLYDKFISVLSDPAIKSQPDLDKKLYELDQESAAIELKWNIPNFVDGDVYERATLMKFVPPACWTFWAQQNLFGGASCVRYVGTAVYKEYAKVGLIPAQPPGPTPPIDTPQSPTPPTTPPTTPTTPTTNVPFIPVTPPVTPPPPTTVTPPVAPPVTPPPATPDPATVPDPDGAQRFGGNPVTPAVTLSQPVKLASDALSLDALNTVPNWNPFLNGDDEAKSLLPLVGPYTQASDLFEAKVVVPVKMIVSGFIANQPDAAKAALQPVADAVAPVGMMRTPAHQFNVDGRPDNRVVFYGGPEPHHQDDVDAIIKKLGGRNMRVVIEWMHMSERSLSKSTQGGTPQDILANSYLPGGGSHVNAYSTGRTDGKPSLISSNWGATCKLNDEESSYPAHLFVVDYQAGTHDQIPDDTLAAYKQNADMWDCFAAMTVPFSTYDPFGYTGFNWNPLEVHDQASTRAVATELANLNWSTFSKKYGAFYCAESQYSIANMGPQEDEAGGTLLKKSRFGATRVGTLIETFAAAPGYAGKPIEWCRDNPEIGWRWLLEQGPDNGGISADQYQSLGHLLYPNTDGSNPSDGFHHNTYSNRQSVFLEFIPEAIKGWQAYRPKNRNGLIATPMSTAMVTWSLMHQYMPRDGIAKVIFAEILKAYATGDAKVKGGIQMMVGGLDPNSDAGRQALGAVALQFAGGFILGALKDNSKLSFSDREEFQSTAQQKMFEKAGYLEIESEADKAKVKQIWDSFIDVLEDPANVSSELLNEALARADAASAGVEVRRQPRKGPAVTGLMKFVPPGAWAIWAQKPEFCESYALRYVATAMHKGLAKD